MLQGSVASKRDRSLDFLPKHDLIVGQGAIIVSSSYLGTKFGIIGFSAYGWDSKKDTDSVH